MGEAPRLSRRSLLALATLAACHRATSRAAGAATRVVSITPNTTETLFALGAGSSVVGRSRYCDYPAEASSLPVVGGYIDPSIEAILALRPDLVTGARGPSGTALADRLSALNVPTYFPPTESIQTIFDMINGVASRVGRSAQATSLLGEIREHLQRVERAIKNQKAPRVLLVFGLAPIVVAGPGSFPDEMLRLAGARNAMTTGTTYPTVGIETLVGLDVDVVIDAAVAEGHGAERIRPDQAGWKELRAVRERSIRAVDDNAVLRPGPRVGNGVERLARLVHKDLTL